MLITKPVAICIVSIIIINLLNGFSTAYRPLIALVCGTALVTYSLPYIKNIFETLGEVSDLYPVVVPVLKTCVKITLTALLCEFASRLSDDSGETFLSFSITLVGKLVILAAIMPGVVLFLKYILSLI